MRRLTNLQNVMYHKKYKKIYKLIFTADLDTISDYSNWYKTEQDIVTRATPLWIVCESRILNKRIWITKEFEMLKISTARLDLDVKTQEYSDSYIHRLFKRQKEMVEYLEELLEPCLEEQEGEKYAKCS